MRNLRRIWGGVTSLLLLASSAQAQGSDWRAVEKLQNGSLISVKSKHRVKCTFLYATDDELVCKPIRQGLAGLAAIGPSEFRFDRRNVRDVRFENTDSHNAAVGAAIGAGAGAVFGAVGRNTDLNRGPSTLVGAGFGALLGGFLGMALPLKHGKGVYKR